MSTAHARAGRTALQELYQSLLASHDAARQELKIVSDIEQQHRHTPLTGLMELAVAGALCRPGHHRDDRPQR